MDGPPLIFTHIRENKQTIKKIFVLVGDEDQEKVFIAGIFIVSVLWRDVRASGASRTLLLTLIGGSR